MSSSAITSQMASQRCWVSSDSKCGLKPKGSRRSVCRVPPIPQGLAGRGQLELEGEADGANKAVERPGALIAREAPALAERLERHVRDLPT